MNEEVLAHVKHFFESRGRKFTELNRRQALVPEIAQVLHNDLGTAPGTWYEKKWKSFRFSAGRSTWDKEKPHEEKCTPKLQQVFHTPVIYHKLVKTVGVGESFLADIIKDWEEALPDHIGLAYLPSVGHVKLRLTAVGADREQLKRDVENQIVDLKPLAGKFIYGYNNTTFEKAVGELLLEQGKTIALAESCTGGYVQHKLTTISGSSSYFQGGVSTLSQ